MFYKLANQKKKKKKKSRQSNADLYLSSINIATWTTSHPPPQISDLNHVKSVI